MAYLKDMDIAWLPNQTNHNKSNNPYTNHIKSCLTKAFQHSKKEHYIYEKGFGHTALNALTLK